MGLLLWINLEKTKIMENNKKKINKKKLMKKMNKKIEI